MSTTKEKIDVKALMARAKEKVKTVKASAEKVDSKKDTYRLLPGFSKYEFNGIILRNAKTKNILSFKTGRTKYQLFDDNEKSHNLNKEEIKALFPVEKTEQPKDKKVKVEKPKKDVRVIIKHEAPKESVEEILKMECKNNKKHFLLHLKKFDVTEINKLTKAPIPSIKRDIWRYEKGISVL